MEIIFKPSEGLVFAKQLEDSSDRLQQQIAALRRDWTSLQAQWNDPKYRQYEAELATTTDLLSAFAQEARSFAATLRKKAAIGNDYLGNQ